MDKLLNNLENKLKDVEQDIKSLHILNSCENDVSDSIDFKEEQKENLEELIIQFLHQHYIPLYVSFYVNINEFSGHSNNKKRYFAYNVKLADIIL